MPLKLPRVIHYGDSALLVQYDTDGFSAEICHAVQGLARELAHDSLWTELVPGYDSLLCVFDMSDISLELAKERLEDKIINTKLAAQSGGKLIDIPIVYGGEYGPDMDAIIKSSGLSEKAIIKSHSAEPYLVCMMGFIPGFCFLSEAPAKLHHPRHATPRAHVPAGSVGIAGWQTGIYGLESPGGWQIIGRTPLKLFDKNRDTPFLLEAGDRIRFVPSSAEIFA